MHRESTDRATATPLQGEAAVGAAFAALLISHRATEAERVIVTPGTTHFTVWTVLDDPDEEMRYRVYDAEMAFHTRYPHLCIDFQLLSRRGRPLEQIGTFRMGHYHTDLRGSRAGLVHTSTTGSTQLGVS